MVDDHEVADEKNPLVTLETTRGDMTLELFEQRAPQTVENFLGLATGEIEWSDPDTGETRTDSLYEGTIFHRIIPEFMIQGGDPEGTGRGGPGYTFDDEFHEDLNHEGAGILSMANRGPNTNGSQFFITLDSQPHLNGKHAVFGHVIDGMDTVEDIGSVPTDQDDKPMQDIEIESISIEQ
ncbi:peptidylprolyl isomerase [Haloquadratum walsbyi]|jgi:Peptidyl-prolyl cis-trans isomerase (rotamase) - cyclophilin family|uniref:peptidylprolyl isomerase n=1 Tax=Haloquadratum walsbyi J07HQW2 TaxID=1238425 RepID=U1NF65_9EURY|nr:peptidylprolyl isomerase [Haloquadratum walsbyi]ERG95413.1 MAG: peptidyl-prolyl cis-trans isomerase (rotamase) - cyclophilin family [Haloquadratum walsbyi J07HQW2]